MMERTATTIMKRGPWNVLRTCALACFLSLAISPVAARGSDVLVWYEFQSGDATLISHGEGQPLIVEIPPQSGQYDLLVRMHVTSADWYLTSWSLDLIDYDGEASVVSYQFLQDMIPQAPVLGDHPVIFDNGGQWVLFDPGVIGSNIPMMDFTLRVDHELAEEPGMLPVLSGIGSGGWSNESMWSTVFFADSTPLGGNEYGAISDTPSIIVLYVPEPASIALCVLALFAAMRRHWSVSNRAGVGEEDQHRRSLKEKSNAR